MDLLLFQVEWWLGLQARHRGFDQSHPYCKQEKLVWRHDKHASNLLTSRATDSVIVECLDLRVEPREEGRVVVPLLYESNHLLPRLLRHVWDWG